MIRSALTRWRQVVFTGRALQRAAAVFRNRGTVVKAGVPVNLIYTPARRVPVKLAGRR